MADLEIKLPLDENGANLNGDEVIYQARVNGKDLESLNNTLLSDNYSVSTNKIQIQQASLMTKKVPNGTSCITSQISNQLATSKKPANTTISVSHLSKRPPVDIEFNNVTYTVPEGGRLGKKIHKPILKGVTGKFRSGELTAIMGPSGAGKSTLMNILAGYRTRNLTGVVSINGKERNLRRFRKMSCYIMQDDCLSPNLTVLEAMTVSANLKLGRQVKQKDKIIAIDEILETLGLLESKNTLTISLSGGQRKRLSIALELLNNPPVLYFDEPTSGLDSSSCFQCISLLKTLARGGRTIICTIHQPSARIFEMFDQLYMLAGGQCLYRGAVSGLVPFLSSMGLVCPSYHNPADYMMEVACGEHGDYNDKLVAAVESGKCSIYNSTAVLAAQAAAVILKNTLDKSNDISKDLGITSTSHAIKDVGIPQGSNVDSNASTRISSEVSPEIANCTSVVVETNNHSMYTITPSVTTSLLDNSTDNVPLSDQTTFPINGYQQFWILLKRTILTILRDTTLTRLRLIAHFIIGILLGLIYYDIGNDAGKVMSNAGCIFFTVMFTMFSAMMPTILTFPLEMSVFAKEHLNYWYSLKSYYFAKTLADVPFQILLTASFMMGVYYLTSQPMEWLRFGMMLLITVQTALVSQSIGLLVGAAFNIEAGVFLGPISIIPLVLFSGFFANFNDLPRYLSWLSYVSYVRYSFEGCMVAIYGLDRQKLVCNNDYCHYKYPTTFLSQMSMKGDLQTYGIDVAALAGFFLVARTSSYLVLRVKLMVNK